MEKINVLSLFDGMSCGRIALERSGIQVGNYFASEIDVSAMQIAQKNYPSTVQLGSVTGVCAYKLPYIDLLIGGSPCQGFSFAGLQLAFDDPRSKLFFEFVRIWNEVKRVNPSAKFLLENVRMKKEHEAVITEMLGVEPVRINSALVSAQNRRRLYWTNIATDIEQPEDRGILLKHILQETVPCAYDITDRIYSKKKGSLAFMKANEAICTVNDKTRALIKGGQSVANSNCTNIMVSAITNNGDITILWDKSTCLDKNYFKGPDNHGQRTFITEFDFAKDQFIKFRKLTEIECERLQTVPDNYTQGVSSTQRYSMLGNGWNVDTIVHILQYYKP